VVTNEDLDARVRAAQFAREFAQTETRLDRLERFGALGHSSIDGSGKTLPVYDDDGQLRIEIGVQPDGTAGVVHVTGPPPPTPTTPQVSPTLGGVLVSWDGYWADADKPPGDFARVQVHRVATATTEPDLLETPAATFDSPAGGSVFLAGDTGNSITVRFVAFSQSEIPGPASAAGSGAARPAVGADILDGIITDLKLANAAVSAAKLAAGAVTTTAISDGAITTPKLVANSIQGDRIAVNSLDASKIVSASITGDKIKALEITADKIAVNTITGSKIAAGTITADRLIIGLGGNLLPDPSFESGVYTDALATNAYFSLAAFGNGSATSLKVNCVATPAANRLKELARWPCLAGDQYYLATDYQCSTDWVGAYPNLYLRWEAADGTVLGYTRATTSTPVLGPTWQRLSTTGTAPTGVARAVAVAGVAAVTAGTTWFDNCEVRPVAGGTQIADNAITTKKIAAGAVTTNHLAVGAVTPSQLSTGSGANLVPDPSFEGTQSAALADQWWTITTPGNSSAQAITVDTTSATATSRTKVLTQFPVLPQEKLWLAIDMQTSATWVDNQVGKFNVRWLAADGSTLGYSGPAPKLLANSEWTRYGNLTTAPVGAATAVIQLQAYQCKAGSLGFDNAEVRSAMASASSGQRAEISPEGLRLFDEDGNEAISLVTGKPNYLTLSDGTNRVANISQKGDAGFQALSATSLKVGGDDLQAMLDRRPRGIVAWVYGTIDVTTNSGVEMGYYEVPFIAETHRLYRITWDPSFWTSADGGSVVASARNAGSSSPLVSSSLVHGIAFPIASPPGHGFNPHLDILTSVGGGVSAGLNRLLFTFVQVGAPAGAILHCTGGIGVIEDIGPYIPPSGAWNSGGASAPPPRVTRTTTYQATWSGSYKYRGDYNSYYGNEMLQGQYAGNWGMQAALVGFDANAIANDLNGADLNKAEVYLYPNHWYYNAGGDAAIRVHGWTYRPGGFAADGNIQWEEGWPPNEGRWVDISGIFGTGSRGIALDPNNSGLENYGRFNGVGMANPPQLRLTYTK